MSNRDWSAEPTKTVPVGADKLLIIDSEATDINKLVSLTDLAVTGAWTHDASNGFIFPTILTNKVGIGIINPFSTLYVRTLLAGAGVPSADADDFIIENNGNTGYTIAPTITIDPPDTPVTATATATTTGGLRVIVVTVGGTRYTTPPFVTFSGGGGAGASATANLLFDNVESVIITAGGSGFTSPPTVTFGGPGSGATGTANISGGVVTSVTITAEGTGYTSLPTVSFSGGGGTGATAISTISSKVDSITIVNRGSGYTSDPIVIIDASVNGIDAVAIALTTNFVDSITVNTIGSGYVSAPTITIDAPTGASPLQAVANAPLSNTEVTVINITNGGQGYDVIPNVSFTAAPSPVTATATANIAGGKVTSTNITNGGVGYKIPPSNITITGGDGTGAGIDEIVLGGSAVQSISITNGGTGMTIFNDAGQVGVIDFEHAGGPTQHGRILYDHGAQRMRFLNTSVQGLLIDNEGHVAITPDNVNHPEFFTVASDELDHPTRILVADTIDRLMMGYNGVDPLLLNSTQAQVIVQSGTGDLVIASRGDVASKIEFFTSDGSGLVDRMHMSSNGRLGINEESPDTRLHVTDNVTNIATFETTLPAGRIAIRSLSNSGFFMETGGQERWTVAAFLAGGSGPNIDYVVLNQQTGIAAMFVDGDTDAVGIGGILDPGAAKGLDIVGSGTFAIITREGGIAINRDIASPFISMSEAGVGIMQNRGDPFHKWSLTGPSGADRYLTVNTVTDGHVGINEENPSGSAQLEITSTTAGMLHPRMTTTQRDAIISANITSNKTLAVLSNVLTATNPTTNSYTDSGIIVGSTVVVAGSDITLANASHTVLTVDSTSWTAALTDSDATATTPGTTTFTDVVAEALFVSNTDTSALDYFIDPDWRSTSSQGLNVSEVWTAANLPTPSAGIITLTSGTNIIQQPMSLSDRFVMADLQQVTFRSADRENAVLTYTGTNTLFSSPNNTSFSVFFTDFVLTGNNATWFNITKGNTRLNDTTVSWAGTGGTIGTFTDNFLPLLNGVVLFGFETGLVVRDFGNFQMINMGFFPASTSTGPFVDISGLTEFTATIGRSGCATTINNSIFFISPDLNGQLVMEDVINQGVGQFYQTAPTGTFSAASNEEATNAISSVSDNGGIAVFDKGSALTNILDNDIVVHTTWVTNTAYNGTFEIFAVASNTYQVRDAVTKVAITFGTSEAGTGTTELTRFTATAHGLSTDDAVLPTSTDYTVGGRIRGTPLTNTFDLRVPFVATNTGTWQVDLGTFTAASDESFVRTVSAVGLAPADGSTPAGLRFVVTGGTSPMVNRDTVVTSGFALNASYNGTFVVSNVQANTFDVVSRSNPLIFTVPDSGSSNTLVTKFTSINHGLVNLQGVQLKSDSYNLGAGIRDTVTTSTFELSIAFVASESGTTNVNSLDQTDPRLTVRDCTGSPDSVVESEFSFLNIATPETVTIVTEAVPVAIAGGAWTASNLERMLEPSGGNGISVYNGIEDIEIPIGFFCLLEKVGGGATDIGCTILVNGVDVISNHPHSVNAGVIQIGGNAILSLKTGDTIQMAVLNDSGTANIDVSQANMVLSKG